MLESSRNQNVKQQAFPCLYVHSAEIAAAIRDPYEQTCSGTKDDITHFQLEYT